VARGARPPQIPPVHTTPPAPTRRSSTWRSAWATRPPTSPPTPPKAPSTSTSTSGTAGACSSPTSHPKDFTPVCTTELGAFSAAKAEFDKRNTKLIGLSVDDVTSHGKWAGDIEETQGTALNFPLIGDEDRKVADLYDMIHPNASDTLTVRSVFIIGPDKKVKLTLTYPASTGRNVDEVLRVLDSLQLTADYKVATPVNWTDGQDVIVVPALSDEEANERFPKGFKALKPYLRVTPQPNK
jgi:alkyl hydroperoxide reductase subunit AhpC